MTYPPLPPRPILILLNFQALCLLRPWLFGIKEYWFPYPWVWGIFNIIKLNTQSLRSSFGDLTQNQNYQYKPNHTLTKWITQFLTLFAVYFNVKIQKNSPVTSGKIAMR